MSVLATPISRLSRALPRGWRDFGLQLVIWFGFLGAYQLARGVAGRDTIQAVDNGRLILDFESRLHALIELDIQRVILSGGDWIVHVLNWTYWNSQFTVVGAVLLWVYFKRNEAFLRLRNVLLLANMLALFGFVLMPTAPPRLFAGYFVDTLAFSSAFNHGSSLIELASNPYAAMPSIHAANALLIGFAMASLVRSKFAKLLWTLWPSWVWFTVMATANHFWLDVVAGVGLAVVATSVIAWSESARRRTALESTA